MLFLFCFAFFFYWQIPFATEIEEEERAQAAKQKLLQDQFLSSLTDLDEAGKDEALKKKEEEIFEAGVLEMEHSLDVEEEVEVVVEKVEADEVPVVAV